MIHSLDSRGILEIRNTFPQLSVTVPYNHPYILTNEFGATQTVDRLQSLPRDPSAHRVHIGVSGFFNYDILTARKPDFTVLLDICPQTQLIHQIASACMKRALRPADFVDAFISKVKKTTSLAGCFFEPKSSEAAIRAELLRKNSWLSQLDSYRYIQSLDKTDRILITRGDLLHRETIAKIQLWMSTYRLSLDTFYIANCGDPIWTERPLPFNRNLQIPIEEPRIFYRTIKPLIQPATYVIDSSTELFLSQRIYRIGLDLNDDATLVFQHRHKLMFRCKLYLATNPHIITTLVCGLLALFFILDSKQYVNK